ncbi:BamA/TamA family outer membrane protein [candidate division KSB1 bacterium]|nr:BamA/TamA family outer membrane protein [candidate division KSB1 bacterium]
MGVDSQKINRIMLFVLLAFLWSTSPSFGQRTKQLTKNPAKSDSVKILRKKYRAKKTWEQLVSLPGTLVSLPLVLFFKLNEELVGYTYEHKLVPRALGFLTSDDGEWGLRPRYTTRSGYGIKLFRKGLISEQSNLNLTLTGTTHGRQSYRLWFKNVDFLNGVLFGEGLIRYRKLLGENFYGIGNDTPTSNRSNYDHKLLTSEITLGVRPSKAFALSVVAGYDYNKILEGSNNDSPPTQEKFGESNLPGLREKVKVFRYKLGLHLDTRNRPGNTSSGNESLLTGTVFKQKDGDRFDFWKISADIRQYIHLFHNRVLVLRLASEITEPFANKEIPFYYLSTLGLHDSIRGYRRGRFYDRDFLITTLEYRIPFWYSVDTMLFVDAGQVASDILHDFKLNKFQFGYGLGFRLWSEEGFVASIELGLSDEKVRISLKVE